VAIYSIQQLQQILHPAGWPEDKIPIMSAIGMAESSGRINALNNRPGREYSVGIWQINLLAHPQYSRPQMENPLRNARAAFAIYRREGLRAWASYTDGRYRQYLTSETSAAATIESVTDLFKLPDSTFTPENAKVWIAVAVGALLSLKILRD
jgi:hypothetical protein